MLRLAVDLVPRTAWWSNVRSHVTSAEWELCKEYSKSLTDGVCYICGDTSRNQGRKYDTEAHEIWEYDDDNRIQTLVDIVPLCVRCHQCKHWGRTSLVMKERYLQVLRRHWMTLNQWNRTQLNMYLDVESKVWAMRSSVEWTLDLSRLEQILGKPVEVRRKKIA